MTCSHNSLTTRYPMRVSSGEVIAVFGLRSSPPSQFCSSPRGRYLVTWRACHETSPVHNVSFPMLLLYELEDSEGLEDFGSAGSVHHALTRGGSELLLYLATPSAPWLTVDSLFWASPSCSDALMLQSRLFSSVSQCAPISIQIPS